MEIEPLKISEYLFEKTELLDWIFDRLKNFDDFNVNSYHASEILSILCSKSEKIQRDFSSKSGVRVILITIARHKATKKTDLERIEFLENLFNCLCSVLI